MADKRIGQALIILGYLMGVTGIATPVLTGIFVIGGFMWLEGMAK